MKYLPAPLIALVFLSACHSHPRDDAPAPVTVIESGPILAAAESAMKQKYPERYEQYKPYTAIPLPGTKVWRVRHGVIPVPIGSPTAIVANDGRVLILTLTDEPWRYEPQH